MTNREAQNLDKTLTRKAVRHGWRVAGVTILTASALLASGWMAYAVPFTGAPAAATDPIRAPRTHARPVPVDFPTLSPTIAPTIAPTVAPTVNPIRVATPAPTMAPTPTPAPTVGGTPPPPQTTFTIAVPVIQQTMVLDCETAALQMGLATYGYYYSQANLFARENPDLRAPVMDSANHRVLQWGDPYTNFVGQVNGSDWTPTGYGVYYPVILQIAREIGLTNAYGGEGFRAQTVYDALKNGHAVEVWIETNWTRPGVYTWTAFDGRTVRYSYAEHAVTLSGVSPTQVRVNDPLHGTQYWISKATFETNWADFNNMAVVF